MNIAAMNWASAQTPPQAADKLALMALAWHAEVSTYRTWPSVAAICEFTVLKRKVVLLAFPSPGLRLGRGHRGASRKDQTDPGFTVLGLVRVGKPKGHGPPE